MPSGDAASRCTASDSDHSGPGHCPRYGRAGLVNLLARPGGNTTGVSVLATELDGKRQEILIEALPGLRRMATLADSNGTSSRSFRHCRKPRAHAASRFRSSNRKHRGHHGSHRHGEGVGRCSAKRFVVTAPLRQSPAYYGPRRGAAPSGRLSISGRGRGRGLLAYGPRIVQIFRDIMAQQLVKLLRGIKPADIPVEQPTNSSLGSISRPPMRLALRFPRHYWHAPTR